MIHNTKLFLLFSVTFFICIYSPTMASTEHFENLIDVTPAVKEYALKTVKPILDYYEKKDKLSILIKVSDIITDPETGIDKNNISPSNYMIYDKFEKIKMGFFITYKLSPIQKNTLKEWHSKYMGKNPADVFFAPSADDIIKSKAAFGCTHYARSYIAVVKALGLVDNPGDLRYVISCKADNYNSALEKSDKIMTINGHQFVLARIDTKWIAINSSKGEWSLLPDDFSPDSFETGKNIPVRFKSYPGITFLLRKIGKDFNDGCGDNSLRALMNIYRSGNATSSDFRWSIFTEQK